MSHLPTTFRISVASRCGAFLLFALLMALPAVSDVVQPVSIQWTEQEPGLFLVQWQVPTNYPPQALPVPRVPDDCVARGERAVEERPTTWLLSRTYRCADGIAGVEVGVDYPMMIAAQSTMLRLDLLSGERLIHMLAPGETLWQVPELDAGLAGRQVWRHVRRAVLEGVRHVCFGWPHWILWLAIALLGRSGGAWRLSVALSLGQLAGVAFTGVLGMATPAVVAEAAIALAAAVVAAEALRRVARPALLAGPLLVAGALHGAGLVLLAPPPLVFSGAEWFFALLMVIGMDGTLVALLLLSSVISRSSAGMGTLRGASRGLSYAVGAVAIAGALALVSSDPVAEAKTSVGAARIPGALAGEAGSGMPGSRRVAPQTADIPLQSFLAIEAFEVRHQVLVTILDVAAELELEGVEVLSIDLQAEVKARLVDLVVPRVTVTIDGESVRPLVDRIDFLTVDAQGVWPRTEPRIENVQDARLGLTVVYQTARTPESVELTWEGLIGGVERVPVTITDPESSRTEALTRDSPRLSWKNELEEDPVPTVAAMAVEPRVFPLPVATLGLLAMVGLLAVSAVRGGVRASTGAWLRILLPVALLVGPLLEVAVELPSVFASAPTPAQARRVLSGVLPNVYRAFEFRDEAAVYDRLAVSVTGETLTEVYLEHRQALEMEERGGARARVVAVEVPEVRAVTVAADGGFDAEAVWIVGGSVTHFGHRHFRQNRYDAKVRMVPVEGSWKIRAIELYDEERLR